MIVLIVILFCLTVSFFKLPLVLSLLPLDVTSPTATSGWLVKLLNSRFSLLDLFILTPRFAGRVCKIYVYPLKSCSHLEVDSWEVDEYGLKYDRQYMFGYWMNNQFEAVTLRNCPRMSLVRMSANLLENYFQFEYPVEGEDRWESFKLPCNVDSEFISKHQRSTHELKTNLWGVKFPSVDIGNAVPEEFYKFLKFKEEVVGVGDITLLYTTTGKKVKTYHPAGLSEMRVSQFHDYFPFHIIDQRSIVELNHRLIRGGHSRQIDAVQFRPNFVIEDVPRDIDIDQWFKLKLVTQDGKSHSMTTGNRCPRCSIPNVDLTTGKFDKTNAVSSTLRIYRRIDYSSANIAFLGHYLIHHDAGYTVRIGDTFHLMRRRINLYRRLE